MFFNHTKQFLKCLGERSSQNNFLISWNSKVDFVIFKCFFTYIGKSYKSRWENSISLRPDFDDNGIVGNVPLGIKNLMKLPIENSSGYIRSFMSSNFLCFIMCLRCNTCYVAKFVIFDTK